MRPEKNKIPGHPYLDFYFQNCSSSYLLSKDEKHGNLFVTNIQTTLLSILTHKILARERMTSLRTSLAHLLTVRTLTSIAGWKGFFYEVECLLFFFPGIQASSGFLHYLIFFFTANHWFSGEILMQVKPLKSFKHLIQTTFITTKVWIGTFFLIMKSKLWKKRQTIGKH